MLVSSLPEKHLIGSIQGQCLTNFISAGDDRLLASDVRIGVRLLANGTSLDADAADQSASSSRAPAMFDDQEPSSKVSIRRQSLQTELLNAHEVSQVLHLSSALRTCFTMAMRFWLLLQFKKCTSVTYLSYSAGASTLGQ